MIILEAFITSEKWNFEDPWLKNLVVSKTFLLYSNRPTLTLTEENLKVIESFVVSLYVTESDISLSVDIARQRIFKTCGNSEIRSLPPTRDALIQATDASGYIWRTSHISATTEESPTNWTWSFTGNRIKCQ